MQERIQNQFLQILREELGGMVRQLKSGAEIHFG